MSYETKDLALMALVIIAAISFLMVTIHGGVIIIAMIREHLDMINQQKMKNANNEWIIKTDDFSTIKRLANEGNLVSLDIMFSWRQFDWIYKATSK